MPKDKVKKAEEKKAEIRPEDFADYGDFMAAKREFEAKGDK